MNPIPVMKLLQFATRKKENRITVPVCRITSRQTTVTQAALVSAFDLCERGTLRSNNLCLSKAQTFSTFSTFAACPIGEMRPEGAEKCQA